MKSLLPLLFLLSAQPATAQYQSRIGISTAALRTHLYNASDNESGVVDSRPRITPNAGFTFSRINEAKSGFQGFHMGVAYLAYKQTTSAQSTNPADPRRLSVTTSSHLHYLSLPAEVRFGIVTKSGLKPFVTVGGYVSELIYYREDMQLSVYEAKNDDYATRDFVIRNQNIATSGIYQNIPIDFGGQAQFARGIYRSWNWGLIACLGAEFSLGKAHFLSVRIPVRYSLTDAEYKGEIALRDENITVAPYLPSTDYWTHNTPKGIGLYQNLNAHDARKSTHLFSYGLEVTYGFRFLRNGENAQP